MAHKKFEAIIRDYADALEKNDIDRALLFFTDDAVWLNPKGRFEGKEEITQYLTWLFKNIPDKRFIDDGVGIIVQKDKGIFQHIFKCTVRGSKIEVPTFCTYLFEGWKCKKHWTLKIIDPIAKKIARKQIILN